MPMNLPFSFNLHLSVCECVMHMHAMLRVLVRICFVREVATVAHSSGFSEPIDDTS